MSDPREIYVEIKRRIEEKHRSRLHEYGTTMFVYDVMDKDARTNWSDMPLTRVMLAATKGPDGVWRVK